MPDMSEVVLKVSLGSLSVVCRKHSGNALMVIGYARRMAIRRYDLFARALFKSAVNICKNALNRCVSYG
jgi:hypothetical protein